MKSTSSKHISSPSLPLLAIKPFLFCLSTPKQTSTPKKGRGERERSVPSYFCLLSFLKAPFMNVAVTAANHASLGSSTAARESQSTTTPNRSPLHFGTSRRPWSRHGRGRCRARTKSDSPRTTHCASRNRQALAFPLVCKRRQSLLLLCKERTRHVYDTPQALSAADLALQEDVLARSRWALHCPKSFSTVPKPH